MKLSDFLENVGRPLAFYPSLAKALGDRNESLFICQMAYWKGKESDPNGWIYKESDELEAETSLTYKEQINVRKGLVKKGLLEERYARTEHKMYFRVDWEGVNELWEKHLTDGHMPPKHLTGGNEPPSNGSGGSLPDGSSLNSNSEITPEITREKKESLLKTLSIYGPSVFGSNTNGWWNMVRRLKDASIVLEGDEERIVIRGLSGRVGQFSEAEVWAERYGKSFANLGLEIEFAE